MAVSLLLTVLPIMPRFSLTSWWIFGLFLELAHSESSCSELSHICKTHAFIPFGYNHGRIIYGNWKKVKSEIRWPERTKERDRGREEIEHEGMGRVDVSKAQSLNIPIWQEEIHVCLLTKSVNYDILLFYLECFQTGPDAVQVAGNLLCS